MQAPSVVRHEHVLKKNACDMQLSQSLRMCSAGQRRATLSYKTHVKGKTRSKIWYQKRALEEKLQLKHLEAKVARFDKCSTALLKQH